MKAAKVKAEFSNLETHMGKFGDRKFKMKCEVEYSELILVMDGGKLVARLHARNIGNVHLEKKGIRISAMNFEIREGDEVIDFLLVSDDEIILTLTENAYGQRTYVKEYRKTGRGAKGVKNITLNKEKNDKVIAIKIAKQMDLLIGTEQGQMIRVSVDSIRITHRTAKGVRVIKLYENDFVTGIGKCEKEDKLS